MAVSIISFAKDLLKSSVHFFFFFNANGKTLDGLDDFVSGDSSMSDFKLLTLFPATMLSLLIGRVFFFLTFLRLFYRSNHVACQGR